MYANRKIKSRAKRRPVCIVLAAWLISVLACSQGYVGSTELTATAALLPTRADTATALPPTPGPPDPPTQTAIGSSDQPPVMIIDQPTPTPTRVRPTKTATKTATPGRSEERRVGKEC